MFYGNDPDGSGYKTRAHLAKVVALLGPPPLELLKQGSRSHEFFSDDGQYRFISCLSRILINILGEWKADVPISENSLEKLEQNVKGEQKAEFVRFMKLMLQWKPDDRKTAAQLLGDPWLKGVL